MLAVCTHLTLPTEYCQVRENIGGYVCQWLYTGVGGADKVIKLWEIDTQLCIQDYRGHSDVVRDVKVISSELFLSASNDWYAANNNG